MEKLTAKELTDKGICPTCYNREHNNIVFGDNTDQILYKNDLFECYLSTSPRSPGHIIISSNKHYKDMMEIPNDLCREIFLFSKDMMNIIKKAYNAESVYLCTMCDGPMNHFHIQLIPRYSYEERGSKNFVKERKEYIEDLEKIGLIKEMISKLYS